MGLRIVVGREREIGACVPKEYGGIEAELEKGAEPVGSFKASLHSLQGEKRKLDIPGESEAMGLSEDLKGATYRVAQVKKRQIRQRPAAPFITSSLQQEAWRKLRFPARTTMLLAQQLYEGLPVGDEGAVRLISYMRTDSTNAPPHAIP